jgi:hypothetical protein
VCCKAPLPVETIGYVEVAIFMVLQKWGMSWTAKIERLEGKGGCKILDAMRTLLMGFGACEPDDRCFAAAALASEGSSIANLQLWWCFSRVINSRSGLY